MSDEHDDDTIYCHCPVCDRYVATTADEIFGDLMLVEHETPNELTDRFPVEVFMKDHFEQRELVIREGPCEGSFKSVDAMNSE